MNLPEASAPSYLGDLDDLEGRTGLLEPGLTYTLPLMPLDGVVLCPGDTLPHRLLSPSDRLIARQALDAAPPVHRLLVVVCCQNVFHGTRGMHFENIGCTAEIIKMSEDGVNIVASGRQRVQLALDEMNYPFDLHHVPVKILPDWPATPIPRCALEGAASWPPWVYRHRVDASDLATHLKALFTERMPKAQPFQGDDPLQLSFWMVSNLPLDNVQRQRLLAAPEVIQRLNMEIELLTDLTHLYCIRCQNQVAKAEDAVPLNDGCISGRFVNSNGVIHDVLTVSQAERIYTNDFPERAHTWFPGFAWQVAYCAECNYHLGWRFTKVLEVQTEEGDYSIAGIFDAFARGEVPIVPPRRLRARPDETALEAETLVFWGLRRAAVTPNPEEFPLLDAGWQIDDEDDSEEDDGDGDGDFVP